MTAATILTYNRVYKCMNVIKYETDIDRIDKKKLLQKKREKRKEETNPYQKKSGTTLKVHQTPTTLPRLCPARKRKEKRREKREERKEKRGKRKETPIREEFIQFTPTAMYSNKPTSAFYSNVAGSKAPRTTSQLQCLSTRSNWMFLT